MTRIVIVDPQPAVRAGLAALLRSEPGLVPVATAGTAEEALETVARTAPDLVLLEPLLGTGDGLQLIRRITGAEEGPRVVAYTEVGDPALTSALHVDVELERPEVAAVLKAFTDLRLALATRLDLQEGDEDFWDSLPEDDPRGHLHDVYEWVGWLQETLVGAATP